MTWLLILIAAAFATSRCRAVLPPCAAVVLTGSMFAPTRSCCPDVADREGGAGSGHRLVEGELFSRQPDWQNCSPTGTNCRRRSNPSSTTNARRFAPWSATWDTTQIHQ